MFRSTNLREKYGILKIYARTYEHLGSMSIVYEAALIPFW